MNSQRFRRVGRRGAHAVTFAVASMLVAACGQGAEDEQGPPLAQGPRQESVEAARWRVDIESADPVVRARAMDLVAGAPGNDGLAAVEKAAVHDPDARVREQAVLAYRVLAGAEGERFLKDIALGDENENVTSAARAALHLLHEEHPQAKRAWMNVELPDTYRPGAPISVHVRFGSSESAPKAAIQLRPPKGFGAPGGLRWRGPIEAGVAQDVAFELTAPPGPVQAGLHVRLKVDYPEQLDSEVLEEHQRVRGDEGGGHFEGRAPRVVRSVDGKEVQP